MDHHKLCGLFPALPKPEYEALKADINIHGQRLPCLVWNGQLVDGAHRHMACTELGISPKFEDISHMTEAELPALVYSLNASRRHLHKDQLATVVAILQHEYGLTTGQRAMIAAQISESSTHGRQSKAPAGALPISRLESAARLGVGERSVDRAAYLLKHSPGYAKQVFDGKLRLTTAYENVRQSIALVGKPLKGNRDGQSDEDELFQRTIEAAMKHTEKLSGLMPVIIEREPAVPNERSYEIYRTFREAIMRIANTDGRSSAAVTPS